MWTRHPAFEHRPDVLTSERLSRWRHVSWSDEPDDVHILLMDVEPVMGGAMLLRQLWTFDDESAEWQLESNDEWWLPYEAAVTVATAMMEGLSPIRAISAR